MGAPAILFIRRGAGDKRRPLATLKFRPYHKTVRINQFMNCYHGMIERYQTAIRGFSGFPAGSLPDLDC
jgi:hypothetical protein